LCQYEGLSTGRSKILGEMGGKTTKGGALRVVVLGGRGLKVFFGAGENVGWVGERGCI